MLQRRSNRFLINMFNTPVFILRRIKPGGQQSPLLRTFSILANYNVSGRNPPDHHPSLGNGIVREDKGGSESEAGCKRDLS